MSRQIVAWLIGLTVVAAACGGADEPSEIVLMTHDSFALSDGTLEEFENQTGVAVRVLRAGDAGTMVSQAVLTREAPLADVMYGVDNTFLSRALNADIFLPYRAQGIDSVAAGLDVDQHVTPIDFGDVCLNYHKESLSAAGLAVPASLRDLTDPAYAGQLVVENPATSSPGLAFLLATIAEFPGEADDPAYTWHDFWADLRDNDVLVSPDWSTAYESEFAGGEGDRPLVVSYASSPPAGVIFSDPPPAVAPTGVVLPGCFRQVEYAGVMAGTDAKAFAEQLVDYLLSRPVQEDLPLNMFVFPARVDAELPPEFVEHTEIPDSPASLDPALINENRERWIEEWTEIMRS